MRIAFPVIFMRNGVEYAGTVVSSSPRKDQVPLEDLNSPLTREQRFNELRCAIAFWDPVIKAWQQADNVPYLPIDVGIPAEGDFYSEVGAPDAHEREVLRTAQAEHSAKVEAGRQAFAALPPEEQERLRAEQRAANGSSAPTPIHGHNELAAEELRSPDPVDANELGLAGERHDQRIEAAGRRP